MKTILSFTVVAALAAMAPLGAEPVNKKCPVSGEAVDAEVTSKHTVVVGFCCEKCQAGFQKEPTAEKFAKGLKDALGKPVNTVCPVSGEDIDTEKTAVHEGKTIAFCCDKCLAKFNKDPKTVAAKVKADNPGNAKCPVSGKDVDPATAVVHTEEIGFCCEKCQAKFEKDPAAVLAPKKEEE